jgi:ubiquinone/menaquinone biosynthesis C-methylase UbiE
MSSEHTYIPALGLPQLTSYYDASLATIFQEQRFRMPLVQALAVQPGERVLDIGCGTGTLSVLLAEHTPAGLVAGLDIDPAILFVAQRKAATAGAAVALTQGSAAVLPYADASFACVASSLMFHHLPTPLKRAMLAEVRRVLAPGGRLRVLDFGPVGQGALAAAAARLFGDFEEVGDNLAGRVPVLLAEAGFADVIVQDIAFGGVIKLYSGRKPL